MAFSAFRSAVPVDDAVRRHAVPLADSVADDEGSARRSLPTARFALLGEASHGSDEFYRERAC